MWRFLTYTSNFMSKPFPFKDQNCLKSIAISQKPKRLKTSDLPCWNCTYLGEYPPPPHLRENPPPPRARPCHSLHFPQTLTALHEQVCVVLLYGYCHDQNTKQVYRVVLHFLLLSVFGIACSKRSDSGERCEVKKAMKSRGGLGREAFIFSRSFLLRTAPHYLNAWNRLCLGELEVLR